MTPDQTLTKLLDLCAKHGYDAVAIGMKHEVVPQSVRFVFGPQSIVEQVGLESGCGNFHQHQIHNAPFLHPQVWQLKKGKWAKIAEEVAS